MARWSEVEGEVPELAGLARERFDAHAHKTLATLRRDGSPRISGIETIFAEGELWLGMMWRSVKALDLRRDARYALHSGSDDPDAWQGDAKAAGRAEEVGDAARIAAVVGGDASPESMHLFRLDIEELVVVRLNEARDKLVIESWHPGRGLTRLER